VTTLVRMVGDEPIRGQSASVSAVINALEKREIEFTSDRVRLPKKR